MVLSSLEMLVHMLPSSAGKLHLIHISVHNFGTLHFLGFIFDKTKSRRLQGHDMFRSDLPYVFDNDMSI